MPNFNISPFNIVRSTDRSYFDSVREFCNKLEISCEKVAIKLQIRNENQNEIRIEANQPFNSNTSLPNQLVQILNLDGTFIASIVFTCWKYVVSVSRSFDVATNQYSFPFDKITITASEIPELSLMQALQQIRLCFRCADDMQLPEMISQDLRQYFAVRETSVRKLEDKLGELTSKLADFALQNERKLLERREQLEREYLQKHERLEEAYKAKDGALDERSLKLDERAAKINDRENVHERRRIYEDIKAQIQSKATKPELTAHTQNLRNWVWYISGGVGGFFLLIFLICFSINLLNSTPNWVAIGSQVASAATLLGLATFVIRWQNRWFQAHADDEYRLKRLQLDIERASWLVELGMEWFNETKSPIPQDLLDKLSAHLFTEGAEVSNDISPLESLRTGLLGKQWSVMFEPSKVEVQSGKTGPSK